MASIFISDVRYKVSSPKWARIEELGARGLMTEDIQAALPGGKVWTFGTHREFLLTTATLNFHDKDSADAPEDSSY